MASARMSVSCEGSMSFSRTDPVNGYHRCERCGQSVEPFGHERSRILDVHTRMLELTDEDYRR